MKSHAFIGALAFALCAGASSAQVVTPHPDILRYGVAKVRASQQTSLTATTPLHYRFEAFVQAQPNGAVNLARVQGPAISAQLLPQGPLGWNYRSNFYVNADQLDTDFPNFTNEPNGNYSIRIDHGAPNDGGFDYAVPFRFGGTNAYPAANPLLAIDGAAFADGRFVVEGTQTAAFRFDFADYHAPTDFISLTLFGAGGEVVHQSYFFQAANAPAHVEFAAHTFLTGAVYTGSLLFGRVVDTDDAIAGADGFAYFGRETNFEFTVVAAAVPEPTSWAVIFGAASFLAFAVRRRAVR